MSQNLISKIHEVIISEKDMTIAAAYDFNKDEVVKFFNVQNHPEKDTFIDIVIDRITETFFKSKTNTEHRMYFVEAVRGRMDDCEVSFELYSENKLTDFIHDVQEILYKSQNPNL